MLFRSTSLTIRRCLCLTRHQNTIRSTIKAIASKENPNRGILTIPPAVHRLSIVIKLFQYGLTRQSLYIIYRDNRDVVNFGILATDRINAKATIVNFNCCRTFAKSLRAYGKKIISF